LPRLLSTIRHHPTSTLFPYTTLFRSLPLSLSDMRWMGSAARGRRSARAIWDAGHEVDWHHRRGRLDRVVGDRAASAPGPVAGGRSEEHTSELQSRSDLVCRLLLEKKK